MSHVGTGYDINQTFIIEPLDNAVPILSACTALYTNNILSCSGNTQIFLGAGVISFDGNLYTNDNLSANTINASTYYSGGTNLIDIVSLNTITGGTFNNNTDTLTLYKQDNSTVVVTGFTDYYTTGATLIGDTVYFDRNDQLSAYTVNLSSLVVNDKYVTGVTFTDNQLIIARNDGVNLNTFINTFTGLTVNGILNVDRLNANVISATTISATTFYGDGSHLTGLVTQDTRVTGFTYTPNTFTIYDTTGGTYSASFNEVSGLTISGQLISDSISANTISATTFYGDGSNLTGLVTQDTYVTGGTYSNGTAIFTNNTGGTFNVSGFYTGYTAPIDVYVTGGTYSNGNTTFINNTGGTFSVTGLTTPFSGGSVTGLTATTISATTYQNLPLDIHVTGFTFNNGNYDITIKQNDGSSYTQNLSILASDVTITGGTYNPVTGIATFVNNTGGTFNVTGFLTGYTDTTVSAFTYNNANTFKIDSSNGQSFSATINSVTGLTVNGSLSATTYLGLPLDIRVTGGTYSNGTATFTNNTGGTFNVSGFKTSDVFVTGGTYSNGTSTFTNNTGGTFSVTGFTLPYTFTGGTVSGATQFTNGLTASTISATTITTPSMVANSNGLTASTISAITYLGLPKDVFVTGGTYTNGNAIFTNNTGGTFNVSGFSIGGGGGQIFYLNLSQSKNGNRYLSTTASTAAEQSSGVTINNGATGTIASFQSDVLGVTLIPGGVWSFYLHSYKNTNNASFQIFVEVYKLSSGGTSTLLFTTDPADVTSNSPNPSMQLTDVYFSGSPVVVTDSIVSVVKATNTGNQSKIITLVSEGLQHYSYVVSTLPTQQGLTCDTLSGCSIIQTIQSNLNNKLDKSGGTITNNLVINGSLSATTYLGLPTDIRVTGGTYSNGNTTFTNNTGGTFSVSGFTTPFTGGTVSGTTLFTSGLTATTISATTYLNTPYWTSGSTGDYSIRAKNDSSIDATGNYSLAEGYATTAQGVGAHAEGGQTTSIGIYGHAEGGNTTAYGDWSHAEGGNTTAYGDLSHAEGLQTTTNGPHAHAEGNSSVASGDASHAEGQNTSANAQSSHAENYYTVSNGFASHAEGGLTTAQGNYSHAEGASSTAIGNYSHSEGNTTIAIGDESHTEGISTRAYGGASHAEGSSTTAGLLGYVAINLTANRITLDYGDISALFNAGDLLYLNDYDYDNNIGVIADTVVASSFDGSYTYVDITPSVNDTTTLLVSNITNPVGGDTFIGNQTHAEGFNNKALSNSSHAEGENTTALNYGAHSEGNSTTAQGYSSHAEGGATTANGSASHAEGFATTANGSASHAEGALTTASGIYSHAEGYGTIASGYYSHAEGFYTTALGNYSHAEGQGTISSNENSHSEGYYTTASVAYSHAEGALTTASGAQSHAGGYISKASGQNSFVHGSGSTASGINTVVLGGGIMGTTDNTVYVPYFNIKYLSGGTSINNLGIDANGYVVSGTTSSNFTGGTVTGATYYSNGLSANTFSATTYLGLPTDIRVTGGTKSGSVITFTNNTGGTFTVTGVSDTFVTGGTYSNGTTTFTNSTGGTFSVSGFNTTVQGITGLTGGSNISVTGANNSYTISFTGTTSSNFTGGTVTGATYYSNGLSANTFSATTYLGNVVTKIVAGTNITINPTGGTGNVTINASTGTATSAGNLFNYYNFI